MSVVTDCSSPLSANSQKRSSTVFMRGPSLPKAAIHALVPSLRVVKMSRVVPVFSWIKARITPARKGEGRNRGSGGKNQGTLREIQGILSGDLWRVGVAK
jgi:hypothetical protein